MSRPKWRRFIWSPEASRPFNVKLAAERELPKFLLGIPIIW